MTEALDGQPNRKDQGGTVMEKNNYWKLFWQTGLPLVWLLSRYEEKPPAAAAFKPLG